jgi:hypothetical protein
MEVSVSGEECEFDDVTQYVMPIETYQAVSDFALEQTGSTSALSSFNVVRLQKELAATELCLEKMREALEVAFTEIADEEISVMLQEARQLQPSLSALNEERAKVLTEFATKWLPNMKRKDMQSSLTQTTHNLVVDDCIKHAFSMASNLRGEKT